MTRSPREDLLDRAVAWFAENGVGDTSLRTLAAALGTSHRMLLYHFGSRTGLLAAVVERVERGERDALAGIVAEGGDPHSAMLNFWTHVVDRAEIFAPLFFELAGHAMQGQEHAAELQDWLIGGWIGSSDGWVGTLTQLLVTAGHPPEQAVELARMGLAMARGLLFDLAVSKDRAAVDAVMVRFAEMVRMLES